jgi:glycosyltransferase involved in cell wall biosynthesis
MDITNGTAAFVIPFLGINETALKFLDETLENLMEQTDSNFRIVLVDDFSPYQGTCEHLTQLREKYQAVLHIISNDRNIGPGGSRNRGIRWAYEQQLPIILFADADDLSDRRRLEVVRKILMEDPGVSVVYSTCMIIDEHGKLVSRDKLAPSIVEILEGHDHDPVQGDNAWISIGIEKGYTNATSATAVRTELAFKYPFPQVRVSEDSHTWMRYAAGGGKFVYAPEIPSFYRIPQNTDGSASRSRVGGRHAFNMQKIETDTQGFLEALEIATRLSKIKPEQKEELLIKFYIKLGETMAKENEPALARELVAKAMAISVALTDDCIRAKNDWTRPETVMV